MKRSMRRLVAVWAVGVACRGEVSEPADPPVGPDPPVQDDEPPPDEEVPDESDEPEPVEVSPPSFGVGLVDLGAARWALGDVRPVVGAGRGLEPWPGTHWPLAGDIGDDGVVDVYVAYARRGGDLQRNGGQVFTFEPTTGTLTWSEAGTAAAQLDHVPVVAIIDLDGDGRTDLLRADLESMFQLATPSGWNVVAVAPPPGRGGVAGLGAVTVADVDMDGWLDVIAGPGECSSSPAYPILPILRTGAARWEIRADLVAQEPVGDSYALMMAPLGGGEADLVFVGEPCTHVEAPSGFQRQVGRNADGHPRFEDRDIVPPDAWFRLDPATAGGWLTNTAPMGALVVDLDPDGVLDLVVAVSRPELMIFGVGPTGLFDRTSTMRVNNRLGGAGDPQLPWGVGGVDLDRDGRPDLIVAHGDDGSSTYGVPWNGPYEPSAWWNDGAGGFVDVTEATGLALSGNWHELDVVDLDGDADPDVLIGGYGVLPLILRNDVETDHHGLMVRLRGTTSNHLGVGAVVRVEAEGVPTQTRLVGERASPALVSTPDLFFGLGSAATATVEITWPTGIVQRLEALEADRQHVIEEPRVIGLSSASRQAPADGSRRVTVTVTPRASDGSVRSANVEITAPWGAATFAGPAVREGDTWTRELVAPTSPGSSVVEVVIDGVPVRVRPRVWWR